MSITVMTRNLYVGADSGPFYQVGSLDRLASAAARFWSGVRATDFPARAGALAREIGNASPHLAGLQEVSLFGVQSPGVFFLGDPRFATDPVFDHLALLLDSLSARGLSFRAVARSTDFDVEGPLETGAGNDGLRLTDREAILARSDVEVSRARGEHYGSAALVGRALLDVRIRKGWASVDARVDGAAIRFVSTHPGVPFPGPAVRIPQMEELLAVIGGSPVPVVLAGDFNSAADGSTTETYRRAIAAGYRDAWSEWSASDPGYTCCFASDLGDPAGDPTSRINLVLVSSAIQVRGARRLGTDRAGRTPSGLWPSDHAGVVIRLETR